jgi:xylulokinase
MDGHARRSQSSQATQRIDQLLFVSDTMPEIYSHTYKFLNVLDYMNLRLNGQSQPRLDPL